MARRTPIERRPILTILGWVSVATVVSALLTTYLLMDQGFTSAWITIPPDKVPPIRWSHIVDAAASVRELLYEWMRSSNAFGIAVRFVVVPIAVFTLAVLGSVIVLRFRTVLAGFRTPDARYCPDCRFQLHGKSEVCSECGRAVAIYRFQAGTSHDLPIRRIQLRVVCFFIMIVGVLAGVYLGSFSTATVLLLKDTAHARQVIKAKDDALARGQFTYNGIGVHRCSRKLDVKYFWSKRSGWIVGTNTPRKPSGVAW